MSKFFLRPKEKREDQFSARIAGALQNAGVGPTLNGCPTNPLPAFQAGKGVNPTLLYSPPVVQGISLTQELVPTVTPATSWVQRPTSPGMRTAVRNDTRDLPPFDGDDGTVPLNVTTPLTRHRYEDHTWILVPLTNTGIGSGGDIVRPEASCAPNPTLGGPPLATRNIIPALLACCPNPQEYLLGKSADPTPKLMEFPSPTSVPFFGSKWD
ncbi:hypothetical protein Pelo_12333 [Pelomyxa schiedti]|nr:hypothetical protein Pelo_12333 [Pelomyxa schiedti]